MDAQRLQFAQQEESENVIEIGVCKGYSGNRGVAHSLLWMQFGRGFDLGPQVRRCAEQEPHASVFGQRELCLRTRLAVECSGSDSATICTGAIPLRKSAASSGAENLYLHLWEFNASIDGRGNSRTD